MENGKPIVVIVRGTEFPAMLAKGMEHLGGFTRFGTGKSVIVKPNFVFDQRTRYPTTTEEQSVLTTVEFLQKEGFNDITVADRRGKKVKGRAGGKFEWSGLNKKAKSGGFKTDSLLDNEVAEGLPREANRLIISGDPLAADIVSAKVLKEVYEPYELGFTEDTFEYAAKLGIGVKDTNSILVKDVEV